MNRFTVWASSPKHEDFKEFMKPSVQPSLLLCMPPWSCDELVECANEKIPASVICGRFEIVGGVARYVLGPKIDLEEHILSVLKPDRVRSALALCDLKCRDWQVGMRIDIESHRLFHMIPNEKYAYRHLDVASDFVMEKLMGLRDVVAQQALTEYLSNPADYAHMWEMYCNHVIRRGGILVCRLAGSDVSTSLEVQRCNRVERFSSERPPEPKPRTLYIPTSRQFPCIDAYTSEYMFQHTAAKKHAAGGDRDKEFLDVVKHFKAPSPSVLYCVPMSSFKGGFRPPELRGCRCVTVGINCNLLDVWTAFA